MLLLLGKTNKSILMLVLTKGGSMVNKRLLNLVDSSKKYIFLNVLFNCLALITNISIMIILAYMVAEVFENKSVDLYLFIVIIILMILKYLTNIMSGKMSYLSSKEVKMTLRELIFKKLLEIGPSYNEKVKTAEIVQLASEGVDQLEIYFGSYLPQLFYAMIAPVTLSIVLAFISWPVATSLFICIPLIPLSIALVQSWAKKLLGKYWQRYSSLGDSFLENLEGLVTLKIYDADEYRQKLMNEEAEEFRRVTMKVLIMQLNSITIMDIVAYGGAALGMIIGLNGFMSGSISLFCILVIIFLGADYFISMRQLGSFFHVATNGMAAADKIFRLLDQKVDDKKGLKDVGFDGDITIKDLSFGYDDKTVLKDIDLLIKNKKITALVGETGSGKSTIASLLALLNDYKHGSIKIKDTELKDIDSKEALAHIALLSHNSYIFKGSVKDNLMMASLDNDEEKMWEVLKRVQLADFLNEADGLDTLIEEGANNLSGGQRQRLALARMLLRKSDLYIFDEATSNIDVESEEIILKEIKKLKDKASVLLIAHRLANVIDADNIYVLDKGRIFESGSFEKLMALKGSFYQMFETQKELENSII